MKERWVDIAKLVAILAVLTDHVHITLYAPLGIKYATYFSVPLFILLMGVTSFWSFEHATEPLGKKSAWRMIHIIISYAVAVFVCYIIEFREFSWIEYKNYVLHFNISGPYYYILLYLQLLAVAPLVFHFLKQAKQSRHPHIVEILWGHSMRLHFNEFLYEDSRYIWRRRETFWRILSFVPVSWNVDGEV